MMHDDDNKRIATVILSKRNAKGDRTHMSPMKPEVVKNEDGSPNEHHLAAQDMISAFHEKSANKLHEAMQKYLNLNQSLPGGSGEPEPESE